MPTGRGIQDGRGTRPARGRSGMRTVTLFLGLSAASLVVMIVADVALGSRAEFLNAYSVVQRIVGQAPSAGDSFVARTLGPVGEFAVVLVANLGVGGILTAVVRWLARS